MSPGEWDELAELDPTAAALIGIIDEHEDWSDRQVEDEFFRRCPDGVLGFYSVRYARRRRESFGQRQRGCIELPPFHGKSLANAILGDWQVPTIGAPDGGEE